MMKNILWFLLIVVLGFLGYYAFGAALIVFKVFIGLAAVGIFCLGFWFRGLFKN